MTLGIGGKAGPSGLLGLMLLGAGGVWAAPALQMTGMTGEVKVTAEPGQEALPPYIAAGSEVEILSGRAWFEAPVHARLEAAKGDRFWVTYTEDDGMQLEAMGEATRLRLDIGGARLVLRGGSIVSVSADEGRGRFKVLRPPVDVRAVLEAGESIRVSYAQPEGLGRGDGLSLKLPAGAGFYQSPLAAQRLNLRVDDLVTGAEILASLSPEAAAFGAETDLRSAVGPLKTPPPPCRCPGDRER